MYRFFYRSFPQKPKGLQCAMRISTEPEILKNMPENESISMNPKYKDFFKTRVHPHRNPLALLMIYCVFNIYYRSDSNRAAITHLIMKLDFLPIPLLIRSTLELWAAISSVEQEIKNFIESERTPSDIEKILKFSERMAYGMKYYPEIDGKQFPNPIESINILTLIDKLAKRYPEKNIRENYDYLCEYCHPNAILPLSITMMECAKLIDNNKKMDNTLFNECRVIL